MITFASLYLGLVLGLQPVELIVDDAVQRVEIRLDDRAVATLEGAPWRAEVDLGAQLEPHELSALAFDDGGGELGSASQWINLPRPPAAAELLVEGAESGGAARARVIWESLTAEAPVASRVMFDGRELEVADPASFALPTFDPAQLHYLRVELDFSDDVRSVAETTFGGSFTDRVDPRQMAVPVLLAEGRDLPDLTAMTGALSSRGRPLRVLAMDEGPADVVIVRDASAQPLLDAMARYARPGGTASLRYAGHLKKSQRARLVSPFASSRRSPRYQYELFTPSGEYSADDGGLFWLLLTARPARAEPSRQRLSDALGVAGMMAAGRGRRRAVVLLLGDEPSDASQISSAAVRGYLRSLRVPLFVWSAATPVAAAVGDGWGEVGDISSLPRFERRVRELSRHLERQRILWVEGVHRPQDLELAPELSYLAHPL